MKKLFLSFSFLLSLFLSFSASAQYEIEEFKPLPKNIEKITALQHSIYEGDTISENYFEYNFDTKGNTIKSHYLTYHIMEEIKYDSLDRIIEIDAVYGESFGNGNLKYYYPSKNQKIEIHDKMGFYKYIKSDFIFDKEDRIIEEIKYDSTINLVNTDDPIALISKINSRYVYDKNGNQIEQLDVKDSTKELIYEMHALYNEKQLVNKTEKYSQNYPTQSYTTHKFEEYFYIKEGNFKDKIEKTITFETNENDTSKSEIQYIYTVLDSINTKKEIIYFYKNKLSQKNTLFYKNNHLIKIEEYSISEEDNQKPKLSTWTEYTYFFYPKSKE